MVIKKSRGFTLTEFMIALAGSVLLLFAVFFGYRLVRETQDNTTAIQQGTTFVMALENYGASSSEVFPAGTFGYGPGASNTSLSPNLQDLTITFKTTLVTLTMCQYNMPVKAICRQR